MSTYTYGKFATAIILSTIISVASTVKLINYAPQLIVMPLPKPDIQLASLSLNAEIRCEPRSDWSTIIELTKTINIKQESVLIIIFSSKVATGYTQNYPTADAFLHLSVYVDGFLANPSEVAISYRDEEPDKGTCMVFHFPNVESGSHTISFGWYNFGYNPGYIVDPVVEIVAIPVTNSS